MIHDDIREARIAAGLSQSECARRAGIPRKQIMALENGANVTLETLRRVIPVLPNLKRVTLGGIEIVTANADLDEARRAALDLFDVAKRLIAALGAPPATPVAPPKEATPAAISPKEAAHTAVGAIRFRPGEVSERETAERLEREVRAGLHKRRRKDQA